MQPYAMTKLANHATNAAANKETRTIHAREVDDLCRLVPICCSFWMPAAIRCAGGLNDSLGVD